MSHHQALATRCAPAPFRCPRRSSSPATGARAVDVRPLRAQGVVRLHVRDVERTLRWPGVGPDLVVEGLPGGVADVSMGIVHHTKRLGMAASTWTIRSR